MGYGSPLYNIMGRFVSADEAKSIMQSNEPIYYRTGGTDKTDILIGLKSKETRQETISNKNIIEQQKADFNQYLQQQHQAESQQYQNIQSSLPTGTTPIYEKGMIIGYQTPTQSVQLSNPIPFMQAQVKQTTVSGEIPYVSTQQGVITSQQYMAQQIQPQQLITFGLSTSQPSKSSEYLNTRITQPTLLQSLGNIYSEFKQPSPTLAISKIPTLVERGVLGWNYLSEGILGRFSEASSRTQAFARLYPEESGLKYSYTVPMGLQLFRGASISYAEGAVGGTLFKGEASLLGIGKAGQTIIGGTMLAGAVPSLIQSYKQEPIKTITFAGAGIAGFATSPTPNIEPITFQKAAFKEIQIVPEGAGQITAKGRIELQRWQGINYKEYTIPFETKGYAKLGTAIEGKTSFAVTYGQKGFMLEKGIGIFKETPQGILFDTQLNPQAVSTRGVIIGKIGEASITRTDLYGDMTRTFKGSIGKGVGITSLSTPEGIKTQPFASKTTGIEIATGEKGSIIYGQSVSAKANEVYIGGSEILDRIGIAARGISEKTLTAKGLTFVPSKEIGINIEDMYVSRNLNLLQGTTSRIIPQIPSVIESTSLKTSFVAPTLIQQTKNINIQMAKSVEIPKSTQISKQIQIPTQVQIIKTIQIQRTIQSTLATQIQIPKTLTSQVLILAMAQIQIPKLTQVQITKQVQVPSMITPTITTPITTPIIPVGGIPFLFPKFRLAGDFGNMGKGFAKGKQPTKYTPSYYALIRNIRGKATKGALTGLELRKIPKGFNLLRI